ncbi:MAG: adenosylcobinamide-phosphate synthase CbiB [Planctomycetota bacterium]|jgi:adenosylcobinamide-phosphate synthase|nr:adenosylcobinamide-phosphate synthase CbiB [Planctomycetota bacterium]
MLSDWQWQTLLAAAVDAAVGDPERLPHPVRWIGGLAVELEALSRRLFGKRERAAGTAATIAVYLAVLALAGLGLFVARAAGPFPAFLAETALIYYSLAARDLLDHAWRVYAALASGDLDAARKAVARIVGRDTAGLDATGVAAAATESVAESLADGVICPLFWAALLGPLGAVFYRTVNTLDSMFGHRDRRYREFGALAARADDVVGCLPARASALLLCAAGRLRRREIGGRAWSVWRRDHAKHASPNAGHPESAMAGLLGVELGGPVSYAGEAHDRPVLGIPGRKPAPADIPAALGHCGIAYLIALGVIAILSRLHF